MASPAERISHALKTALKWAEAGDTQNHECPEAFVEFLDQAYKGGTDPAIFLSRPPSCAVWWAESISLAAWSGAWKCVQYLIENNEMSPDSTYLLLYALGLVRHSFQNHHRFTFTLDSYQLNPKMVQMLLEHGADPYKRYNNGHIWDLFLDDIKPWALRRDTDSELIKCSNILQAFLNYGAQRAGTSSIYQSLLNSLLLRFHVDNVFSKRLPKEAFALRRACDLSRSRKRESTSDKSIVSTERLRWS